METARKPQPVQPLLLHTPYRLSTASSAATTSSLMNESHLQTLEDRCLALVAAAEAKAAQSQEALRSENVALRLELSRVQSELLSAIEASQARQSGQQENLAFSTQVFVNEQATFHAHLQELVGRRAESEAMLLSQFRDSLFAFSRFLAFQRQQAATNQIASSLQLGLLGNEPHHEDSDEGEQETRDKQERADAASQFFSRLAEASTLSSDIRQIALQIRRLLRRRRSRRPTDSSSILQSNASVGTAVDFETFCLGTGLMHPQQLTSSFSAGRGDDLPSLDAERTEQTKRARRLVRQTAQSTQERARNLMDQLLLTDCSSSSSNNSRYNSSSDDEDDSEEDRRRRLSHPRRQKLTNQSVMRRAVAVIGGPLFLANNNDDDDGQDENASPTSRVLLPKSILFEEEVQSTTRGVLVYLCGAAHLLQKFHELLESHVLYYLRKQREQKRQVLLRDERVLLKGQIRSQLTPVPVAIGEEAVRHALLQHIAQQAEGRSLRLAQFLSESNEAIVTSLKSALEEGSKRVMEVALYLVQHLDDDPEQDPQGAAAAGSGGGDSDSMGEDHDHHHHHHRQHPQVAPTPTPTHLMTLQSHHRGAAAAATDGDSSSLAVSLESSAVWGGGGGESVVVSPELRPAVPTSALPSAAIIGNNNNNNNRHSNPHPNNNNVAVPRSRRPGKKSFRAQPSREALHDLFQTLSTLPSRLSLSLNEQYHSDVRDKIQREFHEIAEDLRRHYQEQVAHVRCSLPGGGAHQRGGGGGGGSSGQWSPHDSAAVQALTDIVEQLSQTDATIRKAMLLREEHWKLQQAGEVGKLRGEVQSLRAIVETLQTTNEALTTENAALTSELAVLRSVQSARAATYLQQQQQQGGVLQLKKKTRTGATALPGLDGQGVGGRTEGGGSTGEPETLVEAVLANWATQTGTAWQEALLNLREQILRDVQNDHSRFLARLRAFLDRKERNDRQLDQLYEERLRSTVAQLEADMKLKMSRAQSRFDLEVQRLHDRHAAELESVKLDKESEIALTKESMRIQAAKELQELEDAHRKTLSRLQCQREERESLFGAQIQRIRREAREREVQLEENLERRLDVIRETSEAHEQVLKEQYNRRHHELESTQLRALEVIETQRNEKVTQVRRWFEQLAQSMQEYTLKFVSEKQAFFDAQRDEELALFAQVSREKDAIHDETLRTTMKKQAARFDVERRVIEERCAQDLHRMQTELQEIEHETRKECDERLKRKEELQEQAFAVAQALYDAKAAETWKACEEFVAKNEESLMERRNEVEILLAKRYTTLIDQVEQFLETDVAACRESCEAEVNIRRQQLQRSFAAVHTASTSLEHLQWEETESRLYLERVWQLHAAFLTGTREDGRLSILRGDYEASLRNDANTAQKEDRLVATASDLRTLRDGYDKRLAQQQLLVAQLTRDSIAALEVGLHSTHEAITRAEVRQAESLNLVVDHFLELRRVYGSEHLRLSDAALSSLVSRVEATLADVASQHAGMQPSVNNSVNGSFNSAAMMMMRRGDSSGAGSSSGGAALSPQWEVEIASSWMKTAEAVRTATESFHERLDALTTKLHQQQKQLFRTLHEEYVATTQSLMVTLESQQEEVSRWTQRCNTCEAQLLMASEATAWATKAAAEMEALAVRATTVSSAERLLGDANSAAGKGNPLTSDSQVPEKVSITRAVVLDGLRAQEALTAVEWERHSADIAALLVGSNQHNLKHSHMIPSLPTTPNRSVARAPAATPSLVTSQKPVTTDFSLPPSVVIMRQPFAAGGSAGGPTSFSTTAGAAVTRSADVAALVSNRSRKGSLALSSQDEGVTTRTAAARGGGDVGGNAEQSTAAAMQGVRKRATTVVNRSPLPSVGRN